MIRTADDLKAARKELGWTISEMAHALRFTNGEQGMKRLREMEDGRRDISGTICLAVEALLSGWRPEGFTLD